MLDNPGQICRLKFTPERVSGQIKEMSRYLVGDGGFFKNACLRPYFFIFHVLCFPLNEWWQNAEQVIDEFPLSGSAFLIEKSGYFLHNGRSMIRAHRKSWIVQLLSEYLLACPTMS